MQESRCFGEGISLLDYRYFDEPSEYDSSDPFGYPLFSFLHSGYYDHACYMWLGGYEYHYPNYPAEHKVVKIAQGYAYGLGCTIEGWSPFEVISKETIVTSLYHDSYPSVYEYRPTISINSSLIKM